MPATVTHAFFSVDVYKKLSNNDKILDNTDLNRLKMFAQSTDSLMFYNIESLKKGHKIREFQYIFHTTNSRLFFVNLCKLIKEKRLYKNNEVMSYLYGFICHYVLDSKVHPYIYYKTGVMDRKDKNTYKYNNMHTYMETSIDNEIIIKKTNNKPYNFRLDKFCFDTTSFSNELNNIIDEVFIKTFNIKDMSKIYYKSLKQMKSFLKKYRYDRLGIKKIGYKTIDLFTPITTFKFESLSYHYDNMDKEYFLNENHSIWYNPVNILISSHDSFYDLYIKAEKEAIDIINKVNLYFNNKDIDLNEIFTNKSYVSGLDCNIPLNFKKFAF